MNSKRLALMCFCILMALLVAVAAKPRSRARQQLQVRRRQLHLQQRQQQQEELARSLTTSPELMGTTGAMGAMGATGDTELHLGTEDQTAPRLVMPRLVLLKPHRPAEMADSRTFSHLFATRGNSFRPTQTPTQGGNSRPFLLFINTPVNVTNNNTNTLNNTVTVPAPTTTMAASAAAADPVRVNYITNARPQPYRAPTEVYEQREHLGASMAAATARPVRPMRIVSLPVSMASANGLGGGLSSGMLVPVTITRRRRPVVNGFSSRLSAFANGLRRIQFL